jgi:hypothetical protein
LPERQASAAVVASRNESDAATLRFGSHQDALDYARHSAEHGNRMLASYNVTDVVERYRKGDINIVLNLIGGSGAEEFNLVFFAIPSGDRSLYRPPVKYQSAHKACLPADGDGEKQLMLWPVRKFIQSPEGIIPSFVRIEPFKECPDFRRQIIAAAFGIVPHLALSWPNRELTGFGISLSSADGDNKAKLVKDCPKIVRGFEHNMGQVFRQPSSEFDFVNICESINIFLNDVGPWLLLSEDIDFSVQFGNLTLCTRQHALGTSEVVNHGEELRSNQRP